MASPSTSNPAPDPSDAVAAFEAAGAPIAVLDADGRVALANKAFAALLGLPDAAAARGMGWPDRVDPADRPRATAAVAEATGAAFDVRLDAAAGDARVSCQVTPAAGGRRCLVLRDVAGRRRDERERQQFKFMADLSSDAYFLVDDRSRIVYANRVAHAERGYGPEELVDVPVEQVSPRYDPARVRQLFESTAAGAALRLTHEHRRKDGSTFPVESSVNYLTLDGRRFLFSAVRDVSQQRAAEEALRAERERVALAVREANVGIWFAPVPMGQFYWDAQVRSHFFLTPEMPADVETFYARMHPDDREPTRRAIDRAVAERVPYDVVYRTVSPDGSRTKSIHAIGRCHYDAAGAPTSLDGITLDVTREVRDAAAIRESEARFRHMADHAPVKIWVTEADGRTSFVNARWLRYTGQTMEQALGMGWADAIHPDDRERTLAAFAAANAARRPFAAEYRLRRQDGTYGWMIDSAAPRLDADGRYLGYIGSSTDITARKEAEGRLRESEQRLQLAIEIARLGSYDIDLKTDAVIYNDVGREIYGWPADAALTFAAVRAARHPDDRDRTAAAIEAATRAGGTGHYEAEQRVRRQPDGAWRWLRVRGRAIFGDGPGRPATRVVGTFLDVTDQKAAEDRRERLIAAEQAARADAERARVEAERAQRDAEAAARDAEAAARLKDEFLTTLSHELRTPLNAILGWATLLRRGDKSGDANTARGLETIERNARAQAQLVSDLLDVRHLTSGQLRIEPADADLAEAAADALAAHVAAADAKGLRVETSGLDAPAPLRGDRARLRQVAWNLISNAVKFTPKGGTVRVAVRRADDARVELRVEDTGQGVDAEFLPHVFDRFRMADASTTRRHGGLGLGLAIVRPLVELHGGSVEAFSDGPGRGATFVVTLPASPAS